MVLDRRRGTVVWSRVRPISAKVIVLYPQSQECHRKSSPSSLDSNAGRFVGVNVQLPAHRQRGYPVWPAEFTECRLSEGDWPELTRRRAPSRMGSPTPASVLDVCSRS